VLLEDWFLSLISLKVKIVYFVNQQDNIIFIMETVWFPFVFKINSEWAGEFDVYLLIWFRSI
jgi:hypothetical protein